MIMVGCGFDTRQPITKKQLTNKVKSKNKRLIKKDSSIIKSIGKIGTQSIKKYQRFQT